MEVTDLKTDYDNNDSHGLSDRKSYIDTTKFRFIRDERNNMLHYKDCFILRDVPKYRWIREENPSFEGVVCSYCRRKLYICYGAKDADKKLSKYTELYEACDVGTNSLYAFYVKMNAKTSYQGNTVYVQKENELWRIVIFDCNLIELYHENLESPEKEEFSRLWDAMKYIMDYKTEN